MPIWEAMAESRMTATRLTLGAMSLSSSSHFPLKPNSDDKNPVQRLWRGSEKSPPGGRNITLIPVALRGVYEPLRQIRN
jgi:hypothetical protein